ncbi:MAG: hypothetical protein R2932_57480 [Caldilineaceae bacterium]
MKKATNLLWIGTLFVALLLMAQPTIDARAKDAPKLLEFDTMIGVPKPYTGNVNMIRGVAGGGLPWVIREAKGELKADGKLEVEVKGLVFDPNDLDVIGRGLANQNTVPAFRAVVSCLSKDGAGNPITVNLTTDQFPATTGIGAGDAKIETRLSLPSPCIAPIMFVTSPAGAWFAATGG